MGREGYNGEDAGEKFQKKYNAGVALLGRKLEGDYTLKQVIGAGSFATLFLARWERKGTGEVVKLFDPIENEQQRNNFINEAQIHGSLHHENIVQFKWSHIQEFEPGRLYPFIVMEFANMGTLGHIIKKTPRLPVDEAVDYVLQAAVGLQYIHDQKYRHQDVKPANLLINKLVGDDRTHLLISDFGGTIAAGDNPRTLIGTMAYMPPEKCVKHKRILRQGDLYSLGIVAFEILTGKLPIEGKTREEMARAHVRQVPPQFESIVGGEMNVILEELEPVVRKAIEKRPEERYASMGDFAEELKTVYEYAKIKEEKESRSTSG